MESVLLPHLGLPVLDCEDLDGQWVTKESLQYEEERRDSLDSILALILATMSENLLQQQMALMLEAGADE